MNYCCHILTVLRHYCLSHTIKWIDFGFVMLIVCIKCKMNPAVVYIFFEFWLIYNIILVSGVKHSDIFIDYSFNNFIAHVKTSFKVIAK